MEKLNEKAVSLFKGKNFVTVATVNKDGSPHSTTLWVDTDGKNVVINTAIGRKKERNMVRDERVGIAAFDAKNPYYRVHLNGVVIKRITGKKAEDHISYLSDKYTGVKLTKIDQALATRPLPMYTTIAELAHNIGWSG